MKNIVHSSKPGIVHEEDRPASFGITTAGELTGYYTLKRHDGKWVLCLRGIPWVLESMWEDLRHHGLHPKVLKPEGFIVLEEATTDGP